MTKVLLIAAGGGIGALARYALSGVVHRVFEVGYPLGTFVVNITGCFLFGLLWAVAEERLLIGSETRAVLLVGFMGSFTTFSTFIFESNQLLRDSQYFFAGLNLVGQVIVGIVALYAGLLTARIL